MTADAHPASPNHPDRSGRIHPADSSAPCSPQAPTRRGYAPSRRSLGAFLLARPITIDRLFHRLAQQAGNFRAAVFFSK